MKKLLSILGAMTLIWTASTSVIACGEEKPTPPSPDTRTDIENKITSPIALGQLSENTKTEFLAKLQTALTQIPNLNTITPSDYDVYKARTTIEIQDSDITVGNFLNIKIVAKGSKFQGNKDNITANYTRKDTRTDIENKITSPIALGQLSENTKTEFLAKLQTALTQIPNLNTITPSDYDVYKARTTIEIQDSDITVGNFLNIKIVAKGSKFQGNKDNITTNYTEKIQELILKIKSPVQLL
ncbi:lipoprotein [Spiroplasma ixodetis]|uniref:Lipoprotein n=1 Tax=Spiroplasma ixodetis TaxID=2141 RepID=A0ABM8JQL0_9MOLU